MMRPTTLGSVRTAMVFISGPYFGHSNAKLLRIRPAHVLRAKTRFYQFVWSLGRSDTSLYDNLCRLARRRPCTLPTRSRFSALSSVKESP
jgi:hypothetical protein